MRVIRAVLASPYVGELIVVDDGSTDQSVARVSEVSDARLQLLKQPRNMGKGAALRRGLVVASLRYVVIQDADLEYDPTEYGVLLEPLLDDRADVVYGSRFHNSRPHRVLYYWHSVGNQMLTMACNMATNLNLTDMETCYKMFRREVLNGLELSEDRFGFEPEITAKVAAAGWRIYEVGISYDGRTYSEGKKIGWKDGVRAMYCIGRYGLVPRLLGTPARGPKTFTAVTADEALQGTLESLDEANNYADWIVELLAPYLRGDILEVGAGHGTFSARLANYGKVVASDPSEKCVSRLRQKLAGNAAVEVEQGDDVTAAPNRSFDAIVLINVLEHIEDDVAALQRLSARLKPGGHLLVFVPAFQRLYSPFDAAVGHHRRYERGLLLASAYRAGMDVIEARYVNSLGALAWWLMAAKLERVPTRGWSVQFYDRMLVPWLRKLEGMKAPPIGQSLLLVAKPPSTDSYA